MAYAQDVAPGAHNLIRQYMQSGEPLPDHIQNAPELILGLDLYLGAFYELDGERSHVDVVTRIKSSQIREYAKSNNLSEDQTEDMIYLVKAMDKAHCEKLESKRKATENREKQQNKWKSKR